MTHAVRVRIAPENFRRQMSPNAPLLGTCPPCARRRLGWAGAQGHSGAWDMRPTSPTAGATAPRVTVAASVLRTAGATLEGGRARVRVPGAATSRCATPAVAPRLGAYPPCDLQGGPVVHGLRSPGAREASNQPWESARLRETRPTTCYCPGGGRRVRPDRRTPTQVPTGPARYQPQTVWVYLVRKRWTYPPTGREIAQIIADASTNSPHANATSCGFVHRTRVKFQNSGTAFHER